MEHQLHDYSPFRSVKPMEKVFSVWGARSTSGESASVFRLCGDVRANQPMTSETKLAFPQPQMMIARCGKRITHDPRGHAFGGEQRFIV